VALGAVLAGIAAALQPQIVEAKQLLKMSREAKQPINEDVERSISNERIDNVWVATIAGKLPYRTRTIRSIFRTLRSFIILIRQCRSRLIRLLGILIRRNIDNIMINVIPFHPLLQIFFICLPSLIDFDFYHPYQCSRLLLAFNASLFLQNIMISKLLKHKCLSKIYSKASFSISSLLFA
jgi:hypothetical protein